MNPNFQPDVLPLGVVIPTKNSKAYLESHLRGLEPWIHLAAEVVVVDSFSSDGTVDYIRQNLRHPNIRFFDHPPGLYASWNHGIRQINSPFFFMATTGDIMRAEGIHELSHAIQFLKSDVVIGKPTFRNLKDQPLPDVTWPIDDIISTLGSQSRRRLTQLEAIVFTAAHTEGALLGSSASNLYRTDTWKRLPFPTEFGLGGDGAWAWLHAAEINWAFHAGRFSSFLVHPNNPSANDKHVDRGTRRADEILRQSMDNWKSNGTVSETLYQQLRWNELMLALQQYLESKKAFDLQRKGSVPWSLNPLAWRNRVQRQSARKRLHSLKLSILAGQKNVY